RRLMRLQARRQLHSSGQALGGDVKTGQRFNRANQPRTSFRIFLSGWFAGTRASGEMYENSRPWSKIPPACKPPPIRDRKTESANSRYGEGFFSKLLGEPERVIVSVRSLMATPMTTLRQRPAPRRSPASLHQSP